MKEKTYWTIQASLVYRQIYNPWEPKVIWKSVGFYLPGSVIVFSIPEIIYLSTTKQNSQVLNIFELFRYDKTVIAFIWGEHQVVNPQEFFFSLGLKTFDEGNNCILLHRQDILINK